MDNITPDFEIRSKRLILRIKPSILKKIEAIAEITKDSKSNVTHMILESGLVKLK